MSLVTKAAELSIAQILKPLPDFELKYQGIPVASNPIAIPGTLDPSAGKPGFDENLLAGIPVPVGGDALFYFPRIVPPYGSTSPRYIYSVIWRMREIAAATEDPTQRLSGNLGRRLPGVPEASGSDPGPRFVIPAAVETIVFTEAEPANDSAPGTNNVRTLQEQMFGGEWQAPLSPNFPNGSALGADKLNAAGIVSQGLYPDTAISGVGPDFGRAGWRGGPNYNARARKIWGNELIVLVSRETGVDVNWDFAGVDASFSEFYGTNNNTRPPIPNTGIQLYTGSFL